MRVGKASPCFHLASLLLAILVSLTQAGAQTAPAGVVWPNPDSRANSDNWIRLHHDQIRQMKPRLLVLNFVNGLSAEDARKKVDALIAALRESSRYHGYKDSNAIPFLDYQVYKLVNLTDTHPVPAAQRMDGNSTLYPRVPDCKEGMVNFNYNELFSDKFAEYYDIAAPDNPGKKLTLEEMVNQGIIHEVWFLGLQGGSGAPYDCVEVKQAYDANLRKIEGKSMQISAGNAQEVPFAGRSLRILFLNAERGTGCAMESLGRSLETLSNSGAIPYFTHYFSEYAGFDLKRRYQMPFNTFYQRGNSEFEFPTQDTLKFVYEGEEFTIHPYIPIGGCVRFMPTARHTNDLDNNATILSTIEHYRLHDGPDGKDLAEPWNSTKFARYRQVAGDCQGPWVVYWRQNQPGLDNKALDDTGRTMKNWWTFLFY